MKKLTPLQFAVKRRRVFLALGLAAFNLTLVADAAGDIAVVKSSPDDFELSLLFKAMYAAAAIVLWGLAYSNHRLIEQLQAGTPKPPAKNK